MQAIFKHDVFIDDNVCWLNSFCAPDLSSISSHSVELKIHYKKMGENCCFRDFMRLVPIFLGGIPSKAGTLLPSGQLWPFFSTISFENHIMNF